MNSQQNNKTSATAQALKAIKELKARVAKLKDEKHEPIAVIGMGCNFPGATNVNAFWELLNNGVDAISPIPEDRWDIKKYYSEDPAAPGKMNWKEGGFIDQIYGFDHHFFGISPLEAADLDPQQRLLLETCWHTLENANQLPEKIKGSKTGVFIGICGFDYGINLLHHSQNESVTAYCGSGSALSAAAGRIAYKYGFKGPALSIDTACSSSLVSLHTACQSLRLGECTMAIAGGVNAILNPEGSVAFSKAGMLAEDGRCKTFDDNADGYTRGEGCGMLLLKKLSDAKRNGDFIWGIIKGTAINQDGPSSGLTVPNGPSQSEVILSALDNAQLKPQDIDYIEAHGTGTSLGDPIELNSLGTVFNESHAKRPLVVGSVKTNIGHLEGAAGIAGVIKTILSIHHKQIPSHLHFKKPNQHVDWNSLNIEIPASRYKWPETDGPARAGISSFGFTGTNAHIIVEEAPTGAIEQNRSLEHKLLCLSAKSDSSIKQLAGNCLESIPTEEAASSLAYTFSQCRTALNKRAFAVFKDVGELGSSLAEIKAQKNSISVEEHSKETARPSHPVFLFTGQGSQRAGMGKDLYSKAETFTKTIDECDKIFSQYYSKSLRDHFILNSESSEIQDTQFAQPCLFMLELALGKQWIAWGVKPAAFIGHSIGEVTAACLSGVFSMENACRLIAHRAMGMSAIKTDGSMAAVMCSESELSPFLEKYSKHIKIAGQNSPVNTVISGNTEAIDQLLEEIKDKGFRAKKLNTSHAFHSHLMEDMIPEFKKVIQEIDYKPATIPIYSTHSGKKAEPSDLSNSEYWISQLLNPVNFEKSIHAAIEDGLNVFIECGPDGTLCRLADQCEDHLITVPSLEKDQNEIRQFLTACGTLFINKIPFDQSSIANWVGGCKTTNTPVYPFTKTLHRKEFKQSVSILEEKNETTQTIISKDVKGLETTTVNSLQELKKIVSNISLISVQDLEEDASFISIGFDSLMLNRLSQHLQKKFGIKLSLKKLYTELSTIKKLASYLEKKGVSAVEVEPVRRKSLIQQASGSQECPVPSDVNQSELKRVIDSQLQIMREQLRLLGSDQDPSLIFNPQIQDRPLPKQNFRDLHIEKEELNDEQEKFVTELINRYTQKTQKSKANTDCFRSNLADWKSTLHYRHSLKEIKYPIISQKSEDVYLWDIDGNRYIDIAMGMGVHFFAHKHPILMDAMQKQIQEGIELGPQNHLAGETAKLICELTGNERCTFSITGSEAVMAAVRLARAGTNRKKIVIFNGSYHGVFDGVLAQDNAGQVTPLSPGSPFGMVDDIILLDYGLQESLDKVEALGNELAAVLVEPVQSRRPDFQPQAFLKSLRQITEQSEAALIFDEMINGFRSHPGGAQAYFDVRADIVVYGKVIGGGMPLSVICGKAKFLDLIDGGQWQYGDDSAPQEEVIVFGGTFSRHPFALATAQATLQAMKAEGDTLQNKVTELTEYFADRANYYFEQKKVPLRIARFTSQFRFDGYTDDFLLELFFAILIEKGVFTWEHRICFFSTAHTREHADAILEAIIEAVDQIRAGGFAFEAPAYLQPRFIPMSSVQKRLYTLSMTEDGDRAYHLGNVISMKGDLDVFVLEQAYRTVIQRHESLRTAFKVINGDLVQHIKEHVPFKFEKLEIIGGNINRAILDFRKRFDLSKAPLLRIGIAQIADDEHIIAAIMPHIATDGLTANVIAAEIIEIYQKTELEPVEFQYRHCQKMVESWNETPEYKKQKEFWLHELSGELPLLDLPSDYPRKQEKSFKGDYKSLKISQEKTSRIKHLAKENETSLYVVLLSIYGTFLQRLSGQEDILMGFPASGRPSQEFEHATGMFVNSLAMRLKPKHDQSFIEFLKRTAQHSLESYENQDFPYEDLIRDLGIRSETGRNPLFDTMLSYENEDSRSVSIGDLIFEQIEYPWDTCILDFALDILELNGELKLTFTYSTDLYKADTISSWLSSFETLLNNILDNPTLQLGAYPCLTDEAHSRIINEFNQTQADYPKTKSLIQLFDAICKSHSDSIAIEEWNGTSINYSELAKRSQQIANTLLEHGIEAGQRVALLLKRNIDSVASMLGVMRVGAAYVPLDPTHPESRIQYILEQSQCSLILVEKTFKHLVKGNKLVEIKNALKGECVSIDLSTPNSSCYVIYTSGSTGKPKGCEITHKNVVRLIKNDRHDFEFNANDTWIAAHSFCFDFSVWEIYGALLYGGKVIIPQQEDVRDTQTFLTIVDEGNVTVLNQTPAAFYNFIEIALNNEKNLDRLRYVIFGGDRLDPVYLKPWTDKYGFNKPALINMYGITETTVHVTFHKICEKEIHNPNGGSPIGRPLPETRVYVLNESFQPNPIGVNGELFVSGTGVCRGYLHQEALTAERFMEDPFHPGSTMYKTGDIGRWNSEGQLEFIGRNDDQLQIRGFRVEVGEIEACLLNQQNVEKAVVKGFSNERNITELYAYIQGDADINALRKNLKIALPEYMCPAQFIAVEQFPLSANGKIDKKALLKPEKLKNDTFRPDFQLPEGEKEIKLSQAWGKVLGYDQISRQDDYFALGGDSIKAIQILYHLNQEGWQLRMRDIFKHSILSELALCMEKTNDSSQSKKEYKQFDFAPVHQWMLEFTKKQPEYYNQIAGIKWKSKIDTKLLTEAVSHVSKHHEIFSLKIDSHSKKFLRTEFNETFQIHSYDLSNVSNPKEEKSALIRRAHASLDFESPSLAKLLHFNVANEHEVYLLLHHLICDGITIRILLEDLDSAYSALVTKKEVHLLPTTASYGAWNESLQSHIKNKDFSKEEAFWIAQTDESQSKLIQKGVCLYGNMQAIKETLDKDLTEQLTGAANKCLNTSPDEILISSLLVAWKKLFGENSLSINTEGHGRDPGFDTPNIQRTCGCFTAFYPLRFTIGTDDPLMLLRQVKEHVRNAPENGLGYGLLKYDKADSLLKNHPLAPISMHYLGDFSLEKENFSVIPQILQDYAAPEIERADAIEMVLFVLNGQLHFHLDYDKEHVNHQLLEQLLSNWKQAIREVVNCCINTLIAQKTPTDFTWPHLTLENYDTLLERLELEHEGVEDIYPLSYLQEGMYFDTVYNPDRPLYIEHFSVIIEGDLDTDAMQKSWEALVKRFAVLRTVFASRGLTQPLQIVLKNRELDFQLIDLRKLSESAQKSRYEGLENESISQGFDLETDPLLRLIIFRLEDNVYRNVWISHHILFDGWCIPVITKDLFKYYQAFTKNETIQLPPATPYAEYIQWIANQDHKKAEELWDSIMGGMESQTLASLEHRKTSENFDYYQFKEGLKSEILEHLEVVARSERVTASSILQALWGIWLAHNNGNDDVCFGTIVSGRPAEISGIDEMVGLIINTIPMRLSVTEDMTVLNLANAITDKLIQTNSAHYLPLSTTLRKHPYKANAFDNVVIYENYPNAEQILEADDKSKELKLRNMEDFENSGVDFSLQIEPGKNASALIKVNRAAYDENSAKKIFNSFKTLLSEFTQSPESDIRTLKSCLITDEDKQNESSFLKSAMEIDEDF